MRIVMEEDPTIDGIFVASDSMAAGAMTVLTSMGIRVPTDVAMVGYDDSEAARSTEVPLTTVRQPSEQMGVAMADTLIAVLNGAEDRPRTLILPTELIIRASA